MKVDIEKIFTTLLLPLGLIAVLSAVLTYLGVSLDVVIAIANSMFGLQLLFSLGIDVLKWSGAITDNTAGKWAAVFNLGGIAFIAITLVLNPLFDFPKLDAQLVDVAKFFTLVFTYVVQIVGTKQVHLFTTKGLGIKAFSYSLRQLSHFKNA